MKQLLITIIALSVTVVPVHANQLSGVYVGYETSINSHITACYEDDSGMNIFSGIWGGGRCTTERTQGVASAYSITAGYASPGAGSIGGFEGEYLYFDGASAVFINVFLDGQITPQLYAGLFAGLGLYDLSSYEPGGQVGLEAGYEILPQLFIAARYRLAVTGELSSSNITTSKSGNKDSVRLHHYEFYMLSLGLKYYF